MLSCFGCGSDSDSNSPETEPLLPRYNDDTAREAVLHEKLHTYQMARALSKGYMPSNQQLIVNLRTLLSAAILNPSNTGSLSVSGRHVVSTARAWLTQLIELLESKNNRDQIQDFIWCVYQTKLEVDTDAVATSLAKGKNAANAKATVEGIRTIASLALLNRDFRVFLADVSTIAKQVLRDTATSVGEASTYAAERLDSTADDVEALKASDAQAQPSSSLEGVSGELKEEAAQVTADVQASLEEHTSGEARKILVNRLKNTVRGLRQRSDYTEAAETLSILLKRCLRIYMSVGMEAAQAVEDGVDDQHAAQAVRNFWLFVTSFGSKDKWKSVERSFNKLVTEHGELDDKLQAFVDELANLVYQVLSDPSFLDNVEDRLAQMREKMRDLSGESSLGSDASDVLHALEAALRSAWHDKYVKNLATTSTRLVDVTSGMTGNELVADCTNTFVPLLIQAIQYIPIPRLEVSTPAIDILMENLILQPGRTVNHSSFLPHRLHISTTNDVDVVKGPLAVTSSLGSIATLHLQGLSIAADDLGYWLRVHSGLLQFAAEGIAGFHLDERGIDVKIEVEIGRDRLEELITVRNVDVKVHRLHYSLRKSNLACLAWLLKPLLRPILRHALQMKLASTIKQLVEALNRELLFARERLRATRVCSPDLVTFLRALAARFIPEQDPNVYTRVGVLPGSGVFEGRYAPGSLVKLFEEEARDAEMRVWEYERGGWRNDVFSVRTVPAM